MTVTVHPASDIGELYETDDRTPRQKFGEFLAPYYEIEIVDRRDAFFTTQVGVLTAQGRSFLNKLLIQNVSMDEDIDSSSQIKVTITNAELRLSNSEIFNLGNSVDLFMGYDGHPRMFMGRGIITDLEKNYDEEPTIVITGHDIAYFMMQEEKAEIDPDGSRWWMPHRAEEEESATDSGDETDDAVALPDEITDPTDPRYPIKRGIRTNDTRRRFRDNPALRGDTNAPSLDNESRRAELERRYYGLTDSGAPQGEVEYARRRLQEFDEAFPLPVGDPSDASSGAPRDSRNRRPTTYQRRAVGRSRRAGHVWSSQSDSDIVIAIFKKYEVVPYVELTNESRGRAPRRVPDNTADERPEEPEPIAMPDAPGDVTDPTDPRYPIKRGIRTNDTRRRFRDNPSLRGDTNAPSLDIESMRSERERRLYGLMDSGAPQGEIEYAERRLREFDALFPFAPQVAPGADATAVRTGESGPAGEADPAQDTRRRVVQKAGTSDWAFIQELAKKHGFLCFTFFDYETRQWIGYWGPEENVPPNREFLFRYGAGAETTLKSFRPSTSSKNQSTEINLIYNDPISRHENRIRVNIEQGEQSPASANREEENADPLGSGPEVILEINGERTTVNANHRFTSAEDARLWLVAYWRRHATDFQVIEGETVVGIPELRARQFHQFSGVFSDSGRYFVTSARHVMDDGYQTTFSCRKTTEELMARTETSVESEVMNQASINPNLALPSDVG